MMYIEGSSKFCFPTFGCSQSCIVSSLHLWYSASVSLSSFLGTRKKAKFRVIKTFREHQHKHQQSCLANMWVDICIYIDPDERGSGAPSWKTGLSFTHTFCWAKLWKINDNHKALLQGPLALWDVESAMLFLMKGKIGQGIQGIL